MRSGKDFDMAKLFSENISRKLDPEQSIYRCCGVQATWVVCSTWVLASNSRTSGNTRLPKYSTSS